MTVLAILALGEAALLLVWVAACHQARSGQSRAEARATSLKERLGETETKLAQARRHEAMERKRADELQDEVTYLEEQKRRLERKYDKAQRRIENLESREHPQY